MTRRRRDRTERVVPEGEVVKFPPLPRIPAPPRRGADPRQRTADRIIGGFANAIGGSLDVARANTRSGFAAASVDIGKLKDALESGVARMDISQVRDRWADDVRDWMFRVISTWVQRCKHTRLQLRRNGVEVELETQDDHGYYHYRFDVFPGRTR